MTDVNKLLQDVYEKASRSFTHGCVLSYAKYCHGVLRLYVLNSYR